VSSFVLIPGAWHGAWCWSRVAASLHGNGHEVVCPDLPQSGSLESWAGLVVDILRAGAPPVLVGHSRGGVVISRAAELAPDAVKRLVYVAAYLLPAGGTVAAAARADTASLVAPNMIPARGGTTCSLAARAVRDAFYGCCSAADVADAASKLAPEPLKPLVTPLETTAQRFGRVPRAYVETLRDRAVSIDAQRSMRAALPCDPVLTLDTDHSPFLSRPGELAEWLGRL
jgi:pimeloyl-ACP methyl ester carboxylesterase